MSNGKRGFCLKRRVFFLIISILMILPLPALADWAIETVDSTGNVRGTTSTDIDPAGNVHISYLDFKWMDLEYATNASGSWMTQTIDGIGFYTGQSSSVAVDVSGNVHISYQEYGLPNAVTDNLKYATNKSGVWIIETVDSVGSVGEQSSMALDSQGNVHISYYDRTNGDLKYATNVSGSWEKEIVDSTGNVGWYTSIAFDSSDKVHISYRNRISTADGELKYATNASGLWEVETIDDSGNTGLNTSIAIDTSGNVHISYYDNSHNDLKYVTNISGAWVIEVVDDTVTTIYDKSIALDSSGKVHISYNSGPVLRYSTNASGTWEILTVDDTGNDYVYSSIAIGPSDVVHIGYSEGDITGYLKHATKPVYSSCMDNDGDGYGTGSTGPATCFYERRNKDCNDSDATINPGTPELVYNGKDDDCDPATPDDDVDGDGYPVDVDCNDSDPDVNPGMSEVPGNCKDDDCNASTPEGTYIIGMNWEAECIDVPGNNLYTSSAADSTGKVHISYYDSINSELKYATNENGLWWVRTIDNISGEYTSIAIDSSDKVHVSYYDAINGNLKYATNASGSWNVETVDSIGDVGKYSSIALDSIDRAYISYYDVTNGDLKYATNISGSWLMGTMDSAGDVGRYTAIALDSADNAHISYYAYTNGDLKYMTNASGPWTTEFLDTTGAVGMNSSIAVDSSDHVHISYGEYYQGGCGGFCWTEYFNIKYATNETGSWVTDVIDNTAAFVQEDNDKISIAVDSLDNIHLSYPKHYIQFLYFTEIKHAVRYAGTWEFQNVRDHDYPEFDYHGYVAMTLDSTDRVHISYFDDKGNNLEYATKAVYSLCTDYDGDGYGADLTGTDICIAEKADIDCDDSTTSINPEAEDIPYDGIDQDCSGADYTDVDGDGYDSAIVGGDDCDDDDSAVNPGESEIYGNCRDDDCSALTIDRGTVNGWFMECVDGNGDVGYSSSVAIDSSDNVHISYYDITNNDIKYATNLSGSWVSMVLDNAGEYGWTSSIALDSSDKVHISYLDGDGNNVSYASNRTGSWVTQKVDSGVVGRYTSIAIDSADKVHVSYLDYTAIDLKYATNLSGSWIKEIVDYDGGVGWEASLALDSSDKAHISYRDSTNGNSLKYVTNVSGSWVAETVAAGVSTNPIVAIDYSGNIHIVYNAYSGREVRYITNSSGSWVTETVNSVGKVYNKASMALDSSGKLHVTYIDETESFVDKLTYASNVSGSWVAQTVDSSSAGFGSTSIAIDSLDRVHISYNEAGVSLKYTTNALYVSCTDSDGDGYGSSASGTETCLVERIDTDCNDADVNVHPAATDIPYDGIDQDCSGTDLTDADGDGYDSTVVGGSDCDDTNAGLNPDTLWYMDNDGDGYGSPSVAQQQCAQPADFVLDNTDCDDSDINIYLGGPAVRLSPAPYDYYGSIQGAYTAAGGGDAIQGKVGELTENLVMNINKTVTIQPGYDCAFSQKSGTTIINGDMEVTDGTVSLEGGVLELR